jgi:hypothetical protein
LLDWVSNSIFDIGVALQAAADLSPGTAGPHLTEALHRIDDLAQATSDLMFAERARPLVARRPTPDGHQPPAQTADRAVLLQKRMAQTARSLQMSAAGAAALLDKQADLTSQPQRIDHRTEIKRWRAFADQAGRLAERWEQAP